MKRTDDDIMVTGIGALTPYGLGLDPVLAALHEERPVEGSLRGFEVAKNLSDRRLLKAISFRDALGLVALESCLVAARYAPGAFAPHRVGLYVGSRPASPLDAVHYEAALRAAWGEHGPCDVAVFGRESMRAKPTALLIGLPNNVLCYGSILMDARGPNSNYTAGATSGALAVVNAVNRLRWRQMDFALAGGVGMPCNELDRPFLTHLGRATEQGGTGDGPRLADGACFLGLERRATALGRGVRMLCRLAGGALSSDAEGPLRRDPEGEALEQVIQAALAKADVETTEVGLILTAGALADGPGEAALLRALTRLFPRPSARPALGSWRGLGQRLEDSGLVEVAVGRHLLDEARLAASLGSSAALQRSFGPSITGPSALVLVGSASGENVCLVVERE